MAKIPKPTHIGVLVGCDNRTPQNYKSKIKLRETPNYYVAHPDGTRYLKDTGHLSGRDPSPLVRLDLDSIQPIPKEQ